MFKDLCDIEYDELALYKLARTEAMNNFSTIGNTIYFLRLESNDESTSYIGEIRTFKSKHDFADFYFTHSLMPRCILLKVEEGWAQMSLLGFFYHARSAFNISGELQFVSSKADKKHPPSPIPPRELFMSGMKDLNNQIIKTLARKKAV